jgi:hypothetical protein
MVRGKDGADVEFGPKINVSEVEGFVRNNHLDETITMRVVIWKNRLKILEDCMDVIRSYFLLTCDI